MELDLEIQTVAGRMSVLEGKLKKGMLDADDKKELLELKKNISN